MQFGFIHFWPWKIISSKTLTSYKIKSPKAIFFLASARFHALLYSSELLLYVKCLFNVSTFKSAQRSAAVDISKKVYFKFLAELFRVSSEGIHQEVATCDVGGWAIQKVLEKSRRFVRSNIHTEITEAMMSVKCHHAICKLIEESLVGSLSVLEHSSQHRMQLIVSLWPSKASAFSCWMTRWWDKIEQTWCRLPIKSSKATQNSSQSGSSASPTGRKKKEVRENNVWWRSIEGKPLVSIFITADYP